MSKFVYNYPTEQSALDRVKAQQKVFEKNLIGKTFLFTYLNNQNLIRFKEISFSPNNYLHLTGLDYKNRQTLKRSGADVSRTYSMEFYERLQNNDPELIKDISFVKGSTDEETNLIFTYTQHKLDNLSQLTAIANKAEKIGRTKDGFNIIIKRYKCSIEFLKDEKDKDNNIYHPISLKYGEATIVATDICPIVAIFSKSEGQPNYQLKYLNAKVKLGKKYFERELTDKLSLSSFENPNVKFNIAKLEEIKRIFLLSEEKYMSAQLSGIS
ncbi:MAG: PBECR4 domain-containing protein [Ruminococcus sp.]|nr:PBECR4 domain-containing protein [Ruminococcus sp.]